MRIALFSDYYPPHVDGGVERVVTQLAQGYARRGHDVRVFTLRTRGGPDVEEMEPGLTVFRAPALQLTRLLRVQSAVSPSLFRIAMRELEQRPADVLHAHTTFFFSSLVAAWAAQGLNRPLVTTLHIGSLGQMPWRQRLAPSLYEATLGRAITSRSSRVVAVSRAVAEHARRRGVPARKLEVIANGVDTQAFRPRLGRKTWRGLRIACVGRLIANKGPQFLIEAAPALLRARPGVELLFAGDGPLAGELRARAQALGIADHVSFLGTRDDVPELLRTCDLAVRPSLTEGMPLTVLEAMACGLPVVATPVGGTAEVLRHEHNGLLVRPGDVAGLADALIRLSGDPPLRARLGRNARATVEHDYDWDRAIEANLRVYEDVLGIPHRDEHDDAPRAQAA